MMLIVYSAIFICYTFFVSAACFFRYICQKAIFKHTLAKLYFRPEKTGSANKKSITGQCFCVFGVGYGFLYYWCGFKRGRIGKSLRAGSSRQALYTGNNPILQIRPKTKKETKIERRHCHQESTEQRKSKISKIEKTKKKQ